jgi:glutathione S-transferase
MAELLCHYVDGSPFARMLRVMARELHLPMKESEIVDFPPPETFFDLNPLGQVPVLMVDDTAHFPTEIALEALGEQAAARGAVPPAFRLSSYTLQERHVLSVVLALGDQLAGVRYRAWAGLRPGGPNVLGFDIDARASSRINATLDWLEIRAHPEGFLGGDISLTDIAVACLILWTESRGPIAWRARPSLEALVDRLAVRPSFKDTAPRPFIQ